MTLTSSQEVNALASAGAATVNGTSVRPPGATMKPSVQGPANGHVSNGDTNWASPRISPDVLLTSTAARTSEDPAAIVKLFFERDASSSAPIWVDG